MLISLVLSMDERAEIELEVIVVSHGAEELLRSCLVSLREHPASVPMRVTVVDSGSPDRTPDMVEAEFPEVRLVRRANVGFSAANNEILSRALDERAAPMFLLLNPDTEVEAGTIDSAVARLESDLSIGMVGVRLVKPDGEFDHASKRAFPTPLSALAHFTGIGRLPGSPDSLSQYRATWLTEDEPGEVDSVNGAFMLVSSEAVREVGLLDEGYWLYMEDLDWCRRFGQAGRKVFYEPAGTAIHVKGGSSASRRRPRQEIAFHRGMGRFYRRFDAPGKPAVVNFAVYLGIAAKLAVSLALTALSDLRSPKTYR
jgi:GT2 family glycosyltransferase